MSFDLPMQFKVRQALSLKMTGDRLRLSRSLSSPYVDRASAIDGYSLRGLEDEVQLLV